MQFSKQTIRAGRQDGFTIIELLVAVAVTALMVGLMFSIVVNVLTGWNKSSGALTAGNQARTVLDQLARDVQSSIMRRDGNAWMVATIQQNQTGLGDSGFVGADWSPSGTAKPSTAGKVDPYALDTSLIIPPIDSAGLPTAALDDYRFGQGGVWLRFISTCSDINNGDLNRISAPRAVAYQIIRAPVVATMNPANAEYRYQLFRSEVRPGHSDPTIAPRSTFNVGYNLLITGPSPTYHYNNPNNSNSRNNKNFGVLTYPVNGVTVDEGGEPGSIRRPDYSQVIASNVIDFGVRFWGRDTDTNGDSIIDSRDQLRVIFPTSVTNIGFASTTNTSAVFPSQSNAITNPKLGVFPEVVEVFVRVLTDAGVAQIESLEKGLSNGNWWQIALANSQVYVRRIDLNTSF